MYPCIKSDDMTQLLLKSKINQKKLNALLFFLKEWDIDAEITTIPDKNFVAMSYVPFSETIGMWKDYCYRCQRTPQSNVGTMILCTQI
jgi:hypothetical protein